MAIYWLTPGFKGRTVQLCVLTGWDFNFYVRSSPKRGTLLRTQSYHRISLLNLRWVACCQECSVPNSYLSGLSSLIPPSIFFLHIKWRVTRTLNSTFTQFDDVFHTGMTFSVAWALTFKDSVNRLSNRDRLVSTEQSGEKPQKWRRKQTNNKLDLETYCDQGQEGVWNTFPWILDTWRSQRRRTHETKMIRRITVIHVRYPIPCSSLT